MKITIVKNGPYIVSGSVPLKEKIITPVGKHYVYRDGRKYPLKDTYSLCRCGMTKTPPFCDGSHEEKGFEGKLVADKRPYEERAGVYKGAELDMMDDRRCAFARFCHREEGDAWQLTKASDVGDNKEEAIIGANECPAGRITAREKDGTVIEPDLPKEIIIIQDPQRHVSGPIYAQGGIVLVDDEGEEYELRNRYTLCRCGKSSNMPFCDATHVSVRFKDK